MIYDVIRMGAMGHMATRDNCATWEAEVSALFIKGTKATGKMKAQLQQQVHNTALRKFLIEK
jgi:hypothetical protein